MLAIETFAIHYSLSFFFFFLLLNCFFPPSTQNTTLKNFEENIGDQVSQLCTQGKEAKAMTAPRDQQGKEVEAVTAQSSASYAHSRTEGCFIVTF